MGDYLPRTAEVTDVCALVLELVEGDAGSDRAQPLYDLFAELRDWWDESRPDGFPARASGAEPGSGASNIVHDFGTAECPEMLSVPQVADPVGELVARAEEDPKLLAAIDAWEALCRARDLLLASRSKMIAALYPPEVVDDDALSVARSREWCWLCMRLRLPDGTRRHVSKYREVKTAEGTRTPMCRDCADYWYANGEERPLGVIRAQSEGRKITSKVIDEARLAQRGLLGTKPKPKSRRKKKAKKR